MGTLVAHDRDGLGVDVPDNPGGPVRARLARPLGAEQIARALEDRSGVVLMFEHGDPAQPLVVGLVQPVRPPQPADAAVAHVDGKRVELVAQDEIVLRCGTASITMRRNGRIVIRGTYVETRASGVNRIRGGSVAIN
ncbi:MAG: DUF6484 domain-containing protein [Nannocystaceae bacterium]